MDLKLPKKTNSDKPAVIANAKQVTIIGANGSGKSRFTQQLIKECGNKAFLMSALRAIYDAETPIISAVGHETDFTICDFAADSRSATPTAAAHLVAFNEKQLVGDIFTVLTKMGVTLQERVKNGERELSASLKNLTNLATLSTERAAGKFNLVLGNLSNASKAFLSAKDAVLEKALIAYEASSPLKILEKGYFGVTKGGMRVASAADVKAGDDLTLVAKDGKIHTKVKEITKRPLKKF